MITISTDVSTYSLDPSGEHHDNTNKALKMVPLMITGRKPPTFHFYSTRVFMHLLLQYHACACMAHSEPRSSESNELIDAHFLLPLQAPMLSTVGNLRAPSA